MEYITEEFFKKFANQSIGLKAESENRDQENEKVYKEKISGCESLGDLIKIAKLFFKWTSQDTAIKNLFQKRSDISAHNVILQGKSKCSKETIKYFVRAVNYANSPQDLATAYYKRAILLQELNDSAGALQDFQLALAIRQKSETNVNLKFGRNLKGKHEDYKNLALKQQQREESDEWTMEKDARKMFCDKLFKLKSPHKLAQSMEDFIEIHYKQNIGRHLVLTKDIPIGTTLLVEKPFIAVLDGTLKLDVGNCHHCLKKNLKCIPCPNCVFAQFCDEGCLSAAFDYHQFECLCLPDLRLVFVKDGENTQAFYMAFKLMCKMGPKKMFKIFQKTDPDFFPSCSSKSKSETVWIPGSNPNTLIYESDSYLPIFHLTRSLSFDQIEFCLPQTALWITKILDICTNYFTQLNLDEEMKIKFEDFIAEMILHHFLCFCQNAYGLCEMENLDGLKLLDVKKMKMKKNDQELGYSYYGRGVFGAASLINHSCVPNVARFTGLTGGTTAFVSLKALKKGDELVISYIPTFNSFSPNEISRMSTTERQNDLAQVYNFLCQCIACSDDWPSIIELEFVKRQFKLCPPSSNQGLLRQFTVKENEKVKCIECSEHLEKSCNVLEMDILLSVHQKIIQVCHKQIMSNAPVEIMKVLVDTMEFFGSHLCQPSYEVFILENLFDKAIELIIYFSR